MLLLSNLKFAVQKATFWIQCALSRSVWKTYALEVSSYPSSMNLKKIFAHINGDKEGHLNQKLFELLYLQTEWKAWDVPTRLWLGNLKGNLGVGFSIEEPYMGSWPNGVTADVVQGPFRLEEAPVVEWRNNTNIINYYLLFKAETDVKFQRVSLFHGISLIFCLQENISHCSYKYQSCSNSKDGKLCVFWGILYILCTRFFRPTHN